MRVAARPEGTVHLGGTASYASANQYKVDANLEARDVAFRQGTTRVAGIGLTSAVTADPARIDLNGLRLAAFGGSLTGSAALENLDRFRVNGQLHNFDIAQLYRHCLRSRSGTPV